MEEQGLRSSPDVAMARFGLKKGEDTALDQGTKAAIKEIRAECEAKIAEGRIMMEAERQRLAGTRDPEAAAKMERLASEFADKVRGLEKDRDDRIEAARRKTSK